MLIAAVRARLGDPRMASHQLMGEGLAAVTLADLRAAVAAADAAIPAGLRDAVLAEEATLAEAAHRWLAKYNRSLYGRIAGYVELGSALAWRYPWPVVAILGIVQVLGGMDRARVYGLLGRLASRLGRDSLEKLGDGSEDVLRRTNRGIFADSVPTVLRAVRAAALIRDGQGALADALIAGHGAVVWDDESRGLCQAITDGLVMTEPTAQFHALAATTLRHFAREQAIFTHHIAARSRRRALPAVKAVPAPVIERGQLRFRPYALPPGFDFRDHDARVDAFGRAFVTAVTRTPADYQVAQAWVRQRFGR